MDNVPGLMPVTLERRASLREHGRVVLSATKAMADPLLDLSLTDPTG